MTIETDALQRQLLDPEARLAERDATISLQSDRLVVLQGTLAELRRAFTDQVQLLTAAQLENVQLRAQVAESVPQVTAEVFNAAVNEATALAKDRDSWKRLHDESETECHRLRARVAVLEGLLRDLMKYQLGGQPFRQDEIDAVRAALSEKPEGTP
jgi:hypothetical protein